jgi:hypothetical protein
MLDKSKRVSRLGTLYRAIGMRGEDHSGRSTCGFDGKEPGIAIGDADWVLSNDVDLLSRDLSKCDAKTSREILLRLFSHSDSKSSLFCQVRSLTKLVELTYPMKEHA